MQMIATALKNRWNISESTKALVQRKMRNIVASSLIARNCIAAARVLVAADSVDARREGNDIAEESNEISQATAIMRETMRLPAIRESLAKMSDELCQPPK